MPAKPVKAKEQYRLVLECRSSGLTDYQWCGEKGICPGTFYGWVRRLRQKGYENIPEPVHSQRRDGRQEVVRIGAQTSALPEAFHCPKPCGAHIRYGTVHRRLCAPCAERYRSGTAAAGSLSAEERDLLGDISAADEIYIVCGYTDMRRSIDGLCGIVQEKLHMDPRRGALYLFCGRRCDRIKALLWEGDGFLLLYKRMEAKGRFRWPRNSQEAKAISWQQFDWLMSGLEVEQPKAFRPPENTGSAPEPEAEETVVREHTRKAKSTHAERFKGVPVKEEVIPLSEGQKQCTDCGTQMEVIGRGGVSGRNSGSLLQRERSSTSTVGRQSIRCVRKPRLWKKWFPLSRPLCRKPGSPTAMPLHPPWHGQCTRSTLILCLCTDRSRTGSR